MSKCLPKNESKKGADGNGLQKYQGQAGWFGGPRPSVRQEHNLSFVTYYPWSSSLQPWICGLLALTSGSLLFNRGLHFSTYKGQIGLGDLFQSEYVTIFDSKS